MFRVTIEGETPKKMNDKIIEYAEYLQGKRSEKPEIAATTSTPTLVSESVKAVVPTELVQTETIMENPEAPVTVLTPLDPGAELDANGLPWDERIHAKTKTKTAKGVWKYGRGLDKQLIARIEEENKQKVAMPAAQIPAAPAPTVAVPGPIESAAGAGLPPTEPVAPVVTPAQPPVVTPPVVEATTPTPAPAPAAPPVQTPPVQEVPAAAPAIPTPMNEVVQGHTLESFKQNLAMTISQLIESKKITQEYLQQCLQSFGVSQVWEMTDQQTSEMFNHFVGYGLITKVG